MKDLKLLVEGFGHFLQATQEMKNEEQLSESRYYFSRRDVAEFRKVLPKLIRDLQHLENVNVLEDVDFYSLSALLRQTLDLVQKGVKDPYPDDKRFK